MWKLALRIALAVVTFTVGLFISGVKTWLTNDAAPSRIPTQAVPVLATSALVDAQLVAIFNEYGAAQTRHDRRFFEEIEADDFILFESDGNQLTRTQDIELMNDSPEDIVYSLNVENMQVLGDSAVVTGFMNATYSDGYTSSWRWIDVCVRRNGQWRIQSTTQSNAVGITY